LLSHIKLLAGNENLEVGNSIYIFPSHLEGQPGRKWKKCTYNRMSPKRKEKKKKTTKFLSLIVLVKENTGNRL